MSRPLLLASFHRRPQERDQIEVRRRDGSEASWRFPTYGGVLPHDLVHLVVECGFGLTRGFWGLVDAGVDPEEANRPGADRFRAFGEDHGELLAAEGLCTVHWHDPALDELALCEAAAAGCAAFGVEPPPTLGPARAAAVREAITRLRARLRGPSTSLSLSFDPEDPEAGLDQMLW